MVESGIGKGIQIAVYVANSVILIGGLVVFSIGVWTLTEKTFLERLAGSNLYVASAAILISTGIVVSIISVVGTIGAVKEIRSLLLTFFVILFLIFVLMLVGGILGYVFRSEVDDRMHNEMTSTIELYGEDDTVTSAWDRAHKFFRCCGLSPMGMVGQPGFAVWSQKNPRFNMSGSARVPESCCRAGEKLREACQGNTPNQANTYHESCYEKAKEYVKGHALLIGGIGIGIACLLIFGMVLSCALFLLI